jgi:hypothetical protein
VGKNKHLWKINPQNVHAAKEMILELEDFTGLGPADIQTIKLLSFKTIHVKDI